MLQELADEEHVIGALGAGRGTQGASLDEFLACAWEIAQTECSDHPARCFFHAVKHNPKTPSQPAMRAVQPSAFAVTDCFSPRQPSAWRTPGTNWARTKMARHQFLNGAFRIGPDVAPEKMTQFQHSWPSSDSAETMPETLPGAGGATPYLAGFFGPKKFSATMRPFFQPTVYRWTVSAGNSLEVSTVRPSTV